MTITTTPSSDCEDVSQDALSVFRALQNVDPGQDEDLRELQTFSKDYTCYMVLGMATMASADGKASGNPMAHMWNMILPKNIKNIDTKGIFLVESTGWVNPIPHKDDIGLTKKGKEYMGGLNEKGYLGLIKRMLSDWPDDDASGEFVVSEFYTRLCYGIPHDDGDIVGFLDRDKQLGPHLSLVMQGKEFSMESIPGTGYNSDNGKACKKYLLDAEKGIEPIPTYQFVEAQNLSAEIKEFNTNITAIVNKANQRVLDPLKADGRVLILSEVLKNDIKDESGKTAKDKILGDGGWLENAMKNEFERVKVHMQVVGKPGDDDNDALVAWMVSFKLKDDIQQPRPKLQMISSLIF